MAFDGITTANIAAELNKELIGGRIYKITQPENDELLLTVKVNGGQKRLLISAGASLPFLYLTDTNRPGPMTAPNFCMLLRKHIQNGRITQISQPGLERVLRIRIEHINELGDLCERSLIVEIMGKHSNLIFTDEKDMILDSIKHVSGMVSSVREVLPGRPYFIPRTKDKQDPLTEEKESFIRLVGSKAMPVFKALYSIYTGLSPVLSHEICYRANTDGDLSAAALSGEGLARLYNAFHGVMETVLAKDFSPNIVYENGVPVEYASLPLTMYAQDRTENFASVSLLLEQYYARKNALTRIRQRSSDLRRIVQTALERNVKKYDLQLHQIEDTKKKDTFRVYGELLNTYGYEAPEGAKSLKAVNYYNGEEITIPLDPLLSASENARKYFEKYNKLKRTREALAGLMKEVADQITHLRSILTSLDIAQEEEDLVQIREELVESGYIRRKSSRKKAKVTSRPFHYISSDGFSIYVGKNNYQNDELTFKLATGNDWWFHAKGIPGSHVIVRTGGKELPDRAFEEAARLAAHYSGAKGQAKVEIDYTQKKNVKKPGGSAPGFVVYYTNYSMVMDSDISGLKLADERKSAMQFHPANTFIKTLSDEEILSIYTTHSVRHFPEAERKPVSSIQRMTAEGIYRGFGLYTKENPALLCYAFFVALPRRKNILLDYFAVMEDYRSHGVGSVFLERIRKDSSDPGGLLPDGLLPDGLLIEVEDPDFACTEEELLTQNRRIAFYEKNGAADTGIRARIFDVPYRVLYLTTASAPAASVLAAPAPAASLLTASAPDASAAVLSVPAAVPAPVLPAPALCALFDDFNAIYRRMVTGKNYETHVDIRPPKENR